MIKKIFIVGFIFTLIVSLANQMDNENKIKEYEKEVLKLQTDKNNLKSDNEKLKEENEKLKEENELSSFNPIQRLFLEIDKDNNWNDIEKIMEKYPNLIRVDIKYLDTSGKFDSVKNKIVIANEEDVVFPNIPVNLQADYIYGKYTLKDGEVAQTYIVEGKECIYLDFDTDVNDKTYVSNLSYCSKDFNIYLSNGMYHTDEKEFNKSQLIDYLKNK